MYKRQGYTAAGSTGTTSTNLVFSTSPTLVTPVLGTPTSGTLTNCTGLPVVGGGTGIATTTAYSVICAGTTATGPFQSLASVGTATHVLTSNGAGALPSFQAAAGGGSGGYVLIASSTPSGVANVDFSSLSATSYSSIVVVLDNLIPATDGSLLWCRLSTAGAYKTGATDYGWVISAAEGGLLSTGVLGAATDTKVQLSQAVGSTGSEQLNGIIELYQPQNTTVHKMMTWDLGYLDAATVLFKANGTGRFLFTGAVDGIRILFSSGNIESGTIFVYGRVDA